MLTGAERKFESSSSGMGSVLFVDYLSVWRLVRWLGLPVQARPGLDWVNLQLRMD